MQNIPSNVLRSYRPSPELLATIANTSSRGTGTAEWRASIPDGRMRCRIDYLLIPTDPQQAKLNAVVDASGDGFVTAIWGAVMDPTGSNGTIVPVTWVYGSVAAPGNVIPSPGLLGLSITEISGVDYVGGILQSTSSFGNFLGSIWLSSRFEPVAGWNPTDEEWSRVCNQVQVSAVRRFTV